jgi:hypothetical protein
VGLNIEITVPPFLPLPSPTCCRRGHNCRVDVLYVMYLVIWSDELVNIPLPIISCWLNVQRYTVWSMKNKCEIPTATNFQQIYIWPCSLHFLLSTQVIIITNTMYCAPCIYNIKNVVIILLKYVIYNTVNLWYSFVSDFWQAYTRGVAHTLGPPS